MLYIIQAPRLAPEPIFRTAIINGRTPRPLKRVEYLAPQYHA